MQRPVNERMGRTQSGAPNYQREEYADRGVSSRSLAAARQRQHHDCTGRPKRESERHSEQPSAANIIGRAPENPAVNGACGCHDRQPDRNREQFGKTEDPRFDRE